VLDALPPGGRGAVESSDLLWSALLERGCEVAVEVFDRVADARSVLQPLEPAVGHLVVGGVLEHVELLLRGRLELR
jgi:hypothetical protein